MRSGFCGVRYIFFLELYVGYFYIALERFVVCFVNDVCIKMVGLQITGTKRQIKMHNRRQVIFLLVREGSHPKPLLFLHFF